jgi:soluble lytic murein transglycosylase-like protein
LNYTKALWTIGILLVLSIGMNLLQYAKLHVYENECSVRIHWQQPRIIAALKNYIKSSNKKLNDKYVATLADSYYEAGQEFNLDPFLLALIGEKESSYNRYAISSEGAFGIQQIRYRYWVGAVPFIKTPEDLFDPKKNIRASAYIVNHYRERCGMLERALQCYNGGQGGLGDPKVIVYASHLMQRYRNMESI